LNWKSHIDGICQKLSRVCFVLLKLRNIIDIKTLRMVYIAMFQGMVSYGIRFWGNVTYANKVLKMQKKAIRIFFKKSQTDHCMPLMVELNVMTVSALFVFHIIKLVINNIGAYSTSLEVSNVKTRKKIL